MVLIDADPYSRRVIGGAIEVHRHLDPGLLESVYEACLCEELAEAGLTFVRQSALPVSYKSQSVDCGLRIDIVVERCLIVEVKAVQTILPIHEAQLLTYMKLTGVRVGLLLNFNEVRLTDGIRRRLL